MNPSLDIVLPCYNPPKNWCDVVIIAFGKIKEALKDTEIGLIIVNDGSSRGVCSTDIKHLTQTIATLKFISYPVNRGKGFAIRKGVLESISDYLIYTDVDFPYNEENIIEMYELLKQERADIIIGDRSTGYYQNIPQNRKWMSKLLKFVNRTILQIPTEDTQAGLKGFNKKGKEIFLQTTINRYLFDLEFLFLTSKSNSVSVTRIPVSLKPGIVFTKMNWVVVLHEGVNFLKILLRRIF